MDRAMDNLANITKLLDYLTVLLNESKKNVFTPNFSVNKEDMLDAISNIVFYVDNMANGMPNEIAMAERIIQDRDKILVDAKNRAKELLDDGRETVERMAAEHEIVKIATKEANLLTEEAKEYARKLRQSALKYTDQILKDTETIISQSLEDSITCTSQLEKFYRGTIDLIYENRQDLRKDSSPDVR